MTTQSTNVLIVDDEAQVRSMLQRTVDRIGYTPVVAEDGQAGLAAAAAVDPAVIVLDLRMPKMDGHTFMRRFESLGLDGAIIVTSADGEMDDVIEAMRHGAIDYLRKPFTNGEIQAALARAMEVHDKRQRMAAARIGETSAPTPCVEPARSTPPSRFPQLLERIERGEIVLPSVPSIVAELRRTIENKEATVDSVARLLASDQTLAARTLQISNSAWYGGGAKPLDLPSVIGRIGFQKVQALAETVWLHGCFQVGEPRIAAMLRRQAELGRARALAMRGLAAALKLDAQLAYFSGLFADVGAAFLLYAIAEKGSSTLQDLEPCLAFVREHHEAVGAQLLVKWGHGEPVVRHARSHHDPAVPRDVYGKLFAVGTHAAQTLVGGVDLSGATPSRETVQRYAAELGLEERVRAQIVDQAKAELVWLQQALG